MIWRRIGERYDLLPSGMDATDPEAVAVGVVEYIGDMWYPMRRGEAQGKEGYRSAEEAGRALVDALAGDLAALVFPAVEVARALSVAAEVSAVVGACGSCGTPDTKLAEIAGVALCGPCLTLALQAVT